MFPFFVPTVVKRESALTGWRNFTRSSRANAITGSPAQTCGTRLSASQSRVPCSSTMATQSTPETLYDCLHYLLKMLPHCLSSQDLHGNTKTSSGTEHSNHEQFLQPMQSYSHTKSIFISGRTKDVDYVNCCGLFCNEMIGIYFFNDKMMYIFFQRLLLIK